MLPIPSSLGNRPSFGGLDQYIDSFFISTEAEKDVEEGPLHFFAGVNSYLKFSREGALLVGQMTHPSVLENAPKIEGIAVKLKLGAIRSLFRIPAALCTDQTFPLEELLQNSEKESLSKIFQHSEPFKQQQLVEAFLRRLLNKREVVGNGMELFALSRLCREPTLSMKALAQELSCSTRHLRRRFGDFVGFSPRLFKRLYRFENALCRVQCLGEETHDDWAGFALDSGYSDQAHFIRDFKAFSGCTPAFYLAYIKKSEPFNTA